MRTHQPQALAAIMAIFFVGCTKTESADSATANAVPNINQQEEVKAVLVNMWDAIEKEDINRYARYIHPDFTQFGETDSVLRVGKDVEVQATLEWIKNSAGIHTEMEEPIVSIRGDAAWITYYWSDHGITKGESFASRGKSTRIFVKEDGQWLCIHGHYTLLDLDK